MSLTVDEIRKKASGGTVFARGQEYYRLNRVEITRVDQFWKGEVGVRAKVAGSRQEGYKTTLLIKKDSIYDYTCTCPAYGTYTGMCKHCVATAMAYSIQEKNGAVSEMPSSAEIRQMIRQYRSQEMTEVLSKQEAAKVNLVPELIFSKNKVKAEFRIGYERLYIIKNLVDFVMALEKGQLVEYGKYLSFYHAASSFSKGSEKLLDLIKDLVNHYRGAYQKSRGYYAVSIPPMRELEFSPIGMDQFFELYLNQAVEFTDVNGTKGKVLILEQDPEIEVEMSVRSKSSVTIKAAGIDALIQGERHLYLLQEQYLYRCSEGYSREMGIFLSAFISGYSKGSEMTINTKELSSFCGLILPRIQRYARVVIEEGLDLGVYEPLPLDAEFKLDSNGLNQVTMVPVLKYGETVFSALADESLNSGVYRDIAGELRISEIVKQYFKHRTPEGDLVIQDDDERLYEFLSTGVSELMELGEVLVSDTFKELKVLPPPKIAIGVSANDGWLNLKIDTGDMSREELQGLLENFRLHRKFHRLKNGDFIQIMDSGLTAAAELIDGLHITKKDLENDEISVPKFRALYMDRVLKDSQGITFTRDKWFKSVIRGLKSVEDNDYEVPKTLAPILRGYQKTGFRWLKTLDTYGFGGILADDMGLGKTIQVISMFLYEKEKNPEFKALVVCPASLVYNWENEITSFGIGLKTASVAGTAQERREILERADEYEVLITSYDLLRRDLELYKNMFFRYQIIDEAQFIKNASTQNARAVKEVKADRKFALTGTPIENRLSELWSIFDYLMPDFLYSYSKFRGELETPIVKGRNEMALVRLQRMIGPFILRRLKKDVLKELPDKLENTVMSKMEEEQKKLYMANALELKQMLQSESEEDYARGKLRILAEITKLRQICCDPRLCYENYGGGSAKLDTCMELVGTGIEGGHKILLFSQFTSMLEIIEKRFISENIPYYKITGATSKEQRMNQVNAFNKDEIPVFLISLKAGGTGLNLTAADMVIHYDPWWNAAAQNQATDRAHRIGQKNVVSVFKLIAKETIEENILKLQESKKNLAEQIIQEGMVSLSSLSKEDLLQIIG